MGAFAGTGGNTGGVSFGGSVSFGGVSFGGSLSSGGHNSMAGFAGSLGVPSAWTCVRSAYGDGHCDCGCGAPDIDCKKTDLAHCDVCNDIGGCNRAACPGRIAPDDIAHCVPPPTGWTCEAPAYADGTTCDCGCGVKDADCADTKPSSCDSCKALGSCTHGPTCPSSLALDDNTRCEVPEGWRCDTYLYGNGSCDCGCGVLDVDCADETLASCEVCRGCTQFDCSAIDPKANAYCTVAPPWWTCPARLYRDGSQCDCGCNAVDPDCATTGAGSCDKCDASGSCSALPCPGLIDPMNNDVCQQPQPPAGWTCYSEYYGNGTCDCGCGVPDVDCRSSAIGECLDCPSCNLVDCKTSIDPTDTTRCKAPVSAWLCSGSAYYDGICDCGCGAPDPACGGIEALYVCQNYPLEGCSAGHRSYIDANHNELCTTTIPSAWSCERDYYDDGLCDCGCGAVDADCDSKLETACRKCADQGSCSTTECPGTILASDNAHCSN
jgi:hypothetical protein